MSIEVCNQGEDLVLKAILNQTLRLKLFTNNHPPVDADTEASFTEADPGSGYTDIALTFVNWVFTPGAPSRADYPLQTFAFTGALVDPVYGYYVVQDSDGKLVWAELFTGAGTPYVIATNGDKIEFSPALTLRDEGD